ncbi:MAG: Asp-tRNA(Asn)/Glu-tRNA(Gln) amidotransferase subunit GatB [Deltaproteobacteria bacterium]|nr:Asp-tRNA(Asn)/Glu-tRNA(Gln) amidotransferase subunit GatB [Deltaproteobacteria bacterium]
MTYETIIGLEVHAQLLTASKIFCSCSTKFGASPNGNSCPVCLALPGVLPVLNKKVVEYAIRAGLATGCTIAKKSVFARKNYFYPDLPKGYQISQYELPICIGGKIDIAVNGEKKTIGLTRIHLEEDAGKLLHEHPTTRSKGASWVDLNRAGVPLIEIVSEPDLRSAEEAVAYLKTLRAILIYLEICDGNMEEGSLRCDANVSIRPVGEKKFGTRVEIKNMNSFRHIENAIHHEVRRQEEVLKEGGRVIQETRLWDSEKEITISMRSKEEANDYRYFPDPDLLPLLIDDSWINAVHQNLPELPEAKKARFMSQHQLSEIDAETLTSSKSLADYYEACVKIYGDAKKISNWILTELLRELNNSGEPIEQCKVKPDGLSGLLQLIDQGKISGKMAKAVFLDMVKTGESAKDLVAKQGLSQVSDASTLEPIIDKIIIANPNEAERYRQGNEKLIAFFVGQVMKETQGKGNPALVNEILKRKLKP